MDWFIVTHDSERITLRVSPPGGEAWDASFRFSEIVRVCFEAEQGMFGSDRLYVFIAGREESYVIPTAAAGGSALFGELVGRSLFDATLAITAATASEGGLFCWPPI
jgi:hypothetical protein